MWLRQTIRTALIAAVLIVAACQQFDPYTQSDMWQPTGANAGNIAAMVANPHDLISGRGVDRSDGRLPAAAIERIWIDQPKQLLSPAGSSASQGSSGGGYGGGGSGSSGSGSGAGTGG